MDTHDEEQETLVAPRAAEEVYARLQKDPMADPIDDELTDGELRAQVQFLKEWWTSPLPMDTSVATEAARRFHVLEPYQNHTLLPSGTLSLETTLWKTEFALTRLQTQLERRGLLDSSLTANHTIVDPGMDLTNDMLKIRECVIRLFRLLESELYARKSCDPTWGSEMPSYRNPFGVSMFESQKLNDFQQFLVYILKKLADKGYQRYRDACYEEILSPPIVPELDHLAALDTGPIAPRQYRTHAWRRVCDIKEFVMASAPKETSFDMWKNMTTGNNLDNVVKYLSGCREAEFQDLKPDRHWHSFQNGIYDTNSATFYPYGHPDLPAHIVSVKYHEGLNYNTEYHQYENPMDIPTPYFESILEYQLHKFDAAERQSIIRCIYVLLGRFLYEVNEKDSWQVIPFFVGIAGTGKSVILDTLTSFFNDEDIEAISNNQQKGFGLETVYDKLGWKALEVKKDFSVDQAQLQSMITGEEVSIMRKGKPALTVVWKAPGIFAGNEPADWTDNSGSISRRIILIWFNKKVDAETSNPHMKEYIRNEKPALLHKMVSLYLDCVEQCGNKNIWGQYKRPDGTKVAILPQYFHDAKKKLTQATHAVEAFINSEKMMLVPGTKKMLYGMPFDDFRKMCDEFAKDHSYKVQKWTESLYNNVFQTNDLEVQTLTHDFLKKRKMEYNGNPVSANTQWIWGITTKDIYYAADRKVEELKMMEDLDEADEF